MSIERTRLILEELMEKTWTPNKIDELLNAGIDIDDFI
jgi:hypothetical protein